MSDMLPNLTNQQLAQRRELEKLLDDLGEAAIDFHDARILEEKIIEADEETEETEEAYFKADRAFQAALHALQNCEAVR
jgi:hypothetical protein